MRVGLFFAAFVVAAVAMLTSTPARAMDGCLPPAGFMRSIQGQVEIKRGLVDWRPAAFDEPLCGGDLIRVGDRSRALAAFANLAERIDQNTTLSVAYAPADKPSLLNLIEGAVYFFSRKPRILEVDTPFFDAAIEGTEFLVRVEPQRAQLTVFDGKITARNAQGELTVTGGQSLVAEAGQAPAPYVLVRPRDAVQWALFYPIILLPLADRSGTAAREIAGPLGEAVELASRGEFTAAFARFDSIPEAERGPEFYLYRAATLLSVGRVDEARADIDQALARDPSDGRPYALSAVIAVAQNENDRALADAGRAVELNRRSAAAKIALSYAEQARFRIEAAREAMQQAVTDEPENALAWARLSELWLMQGYRDRALKAARKARRLAPELERVETVLGFAALAAIDIAKAKQAFGRAIELNSADPRARFGLALATIRGGDLEQGRGDIELAVALDPDDSLLRSYLGKAYFEQRTTDPAKYLRELFTNFPNQENALAAEQYAIAKRLDPNDPTPWLYDAIRKQSENRPVEALRDIGKSIELNDNRAVYRSRELLDQDQAARGTSLARIYNDLSFEQLGVNEATKSLSYDPGNAGAHRFLSDVYATQPRRENARASELLQAQLLQDININPVQPSLSETNLDIITGGGPARPGFNEFTPLFERNQAQLNVTGEIGNQGTRADEAVVSGIYDRYSISAGQFHYETNGFRKNFDISHDIYDLFGQAAITPVVNIQGELRTRYTKNGDRQLNFDRREYQPTLSQKEQDSSARVGARYSPSPNSDVLGSFIYTNGHQNTETGSDLVDGSHLDERGLEYEVQYIYRLDAAAMILGSGFYDVNRKFSQDITTATEIFGFPTVASAIKQSTTYIYSNLNVGNNVIAMLGLSYDHYYEKQPSQDVRSDNLGKDEVNPKFGLQWAICPDITMRIALYRTLNRALISRATIEPTEVSGFTQFYDGINGTDTWNYGIGLDTRLSKSLFGGVQALVRHSNAPVFSPPFVETEDRRESTYSGYVYWALSDRLVFSGQTIFDTFDASTRSGSSFPARVDTISLPLIVRYFSPSGFFGDFRVSFVDQDVGIRNDSATSRQEGHEDFASIDAGIGYRFPYRRGILSLQGRNLLNEKFSFRDDNYRAPANPFLSQFTPERAILFTVTLNL